MSSSQPIPSIACTVGLPVACLLIGRNLVPHISFFSFFKNVARRGVVGRQNSRPPRLLAAAVWNFEQPRPRWVAEHMRRPTGQMFFTVLKDICSLGRSSLCVSAVSPSGTHRSA